MKEDKGPFTQTFKAFSHYIITYLGNTDFDTESTTFGTRRPCQTEFFLKKMNL